MGYDIFVKRGEPRINKIVRHEYLKNAFDVAKDVVLGAGLYTNIDGALTGGIITEVEVYIGGEDKAAHSYPNKRTKRTQIQFDEGGYAYVFLVYGLHMQFCVVTDGVNVPNVILVRSIEPVTGLDIMMARRNCGDINRLTVGPGNVCKALGIKTDHYGADLCGDDIFLTYRENEIKLAEAKRIGIDYAEEYADKLWRFYIEDSGYVSRKK